MRPSKRDLVTSYWNYRDKHGFSHVFTGLSLYPLLLELYPSSDDFLAQCLLFFQKHHYFVRNQKTFLKAMHQSIICAPHTPFLPQKETEELDSARHEYVYERVLANQHWTLIDVQSLLLPYVPENTMDDFLPSCGEGPIDKQLEDRLPQILASVVTGVNPTVLQRRYKGNALCIDKDYVDSFANVLSVHRIEITEFLLTFRPFKKEERPRVGMMKEPCSFIFFLGAVLRTRNTDFLMTFRTSFLAMVKHLGDPRIEDVAHPSLRETKGDVFEKCPYLFRILLAVQRVRSVIFSHAQHFPLDASSLRNHFICGSTVLSAFG
jgi:hypothetical protein